jgi:hypothetical protein
VVHEEVPTEGAIVKIVRALKEQYGDCHLAIGRHQQLKKQNQGDGGSWKKLVATHRGMTHHVIPALCKGHGRQGPGRDNVARKIPKRRMLERSQRTCQEGSNGIRVQDLKEQLLLGSKRAFNKNVRKTFGMEVAK